MNTLTFNVRYHRLYLIFKIFAQNDCTSNDLFDDNKMIILVIKFDETWVISVK